MPWSQRTVDLIQVGVGSIWEGSDGLPGEGSVCMADFSDAVVTLLVGRRLVSVTTPPSGVLCFVMILSCSHYLAFLLSFIFLK